ncbi:unnamed protein product [Diplocarpon coronariae]
MLESGIEEEFLNKDFGIFDEFNINGYDSYRYKIVGKDLAILGF